MLTLTELTDFLQNAHWPRIPERRPTFFSIAKFPHYENVMSNVYQFFFSTENPHGLGSLCVDALGDVLLTKRSEMAWPAHTFRRTHVRRELHNGADEASWQHASTVILIENKVYHWLANDLGDYWDFVKKANPTGDRIGVVLCLNRETIPIQWQSNWLVITHLEWAQAVENRLGPLMYRAEGRYLTLLLELIENIRTMSNDKESATDLLRFFQQNYASIQHIAKLKQQLLVALPVEIGLALPDGYVVDYQANDAKADTWLTITSPLQQRGSPTKYLIQYGGLFKKQIEPEYQIHVINHEYDKCERMRQAYRHSPLTALEYGDRHYTVCKTYTMTSSQLTNFAKHIAASLTQDWIPLEKYWVED
jgi:hypothetical protein